MFLHPSIGPIQEGIVNRLPLIPYENVRCYFDAFWRKLRNAYDFHVFAYILDAMICVIDAAGYIRFPPHSLSLLFFLLVLSCHVLGAYSIQ